ncbi:MAG: DNA topoisomerase I [Gammaproteobacteria bacterium]
MAKNLLLVESVAKATTIKRYLGPDFDVLATYGHVRDLVPKEGAVDPANEFRMHYQVIEKNVRCVDAIEKAMRKADALYLATDLDREGEAISWHIAEVLKERGVVKSKPIYRVVFHEITKRAIEEAMRNTREISMALVNAQQARRALDYLVGFNLSPLLWKKIQRGLSAGRVQSPALRMVAEREEEIESFQRREYWTIEADLAHQKTVFWAKLIEYQGEKLKQFSVVEEKHAQCVRDDLLQKAGGRLTVSRVEKTQRKRNPAPPFMTSTLQQEAVRKLGFTAQRAMRVAQQLYEGIDVGDGSVGLITYMRTDSLNLAEEAISGIREFVSQRYGADQLPAQARRYKTTAKNAQEAHEAIRPTSVSRVPEGLKKRLSEEQLKLYTLIWRRTVACQMKQATIEMVAVDMRCGDANTFRANGSTVADPGFMQAYLESEERAKEKEQVLPSLRAGDAVILNNIRADQHFTEPPPRYSEASLIKTLEEYGIGRPSTYASIIATLLQREYVEMDNKRFVPTDIGRIVNKFLTEHFETYVDYDFTARLEDKLDAISRGEKEWVPITSDFWGPFSQQVKEKEMNVSRKEALQARELGVDPDTAQPVSVRMGRFGPYIQIGASDSEDKPRFVSMPPNYRLDTISLDEALKLCRLPRALGTTPQGQEITVNIGRYGPYIRYGDKFVSPGKDDDCYSITLERAQELIQLRQQADVSREIKSFEQAHIRILKGRYGPYVTDGKKNAKIPKDRSPEDLTLEESQRLLVEAASTRGARRRTRRAG